MLENIVPQAPVSWKPMGFIFLGRAFLDADLETWPTALTPGYPGGLELPGNAAGHPNMKSKGLWAGFLGSVVWILEGLSNWSSWHLLTGGWEGRLFTLKIISISQLLTQEIVAFPMTDSSQEA